jgi:hypothetical protein
MMQPPHRLSDDPAKSELARALRDAQGDVLSPEAVARVRAALVVAGVVAATGAPPQTPGGLGAGPRSPLAKLLTAPARLWVGLACLGLAGAAGVASMRQTPSHPGAPSMPMDQTTATESSAPVTMAEPPEPPAQPVTMGETPKPPVQPVDQGSAPTVDLLPASPPTATTMATPHARASARPPVTAATIPSPREGALLLEARRALGADPARALTLVRAHALEFPKSQLGPERARIAAEARQRLEK